MKYIYSKRAKKRMMERSIRKQWVEECIEIPDYSVSKEGLVESNKKIDDKVLKVVFEKRDNYIKIVSVMWR